MSTNIEQEIRAFILDTFPGTKNIEFADADSLTEKGIVDSQGLIEIVSFVESQYGIRFKDDEIIGEFCSSIAKLSAFVRSRQAAK